MAVVQCRAWVLPGCFCVVSDRTATTTKSVFPRPLSASHIPFAFEEGQSRGLLEGICDVELFSPIDSEIAPKGPSQRIWKTLKVIRRAIVSKENATSKIAVSSEMAWLNMETILSRWLGPWYRTLQKGNFHPRVPLPISVLKKIVTRSSRHFCSAYYMGGTVLRLHINSSLIPMKTTRKVLFCQGFIYGRMEAQRDFINCWLRQQWTIEEDINSVLWFIIY